MFIKINSIATNMIILDYETTGRNPEKHAIIAWGAVDFNNSTNVFYEEPRIWKGAEIDSKALEINGFTVAEIGSPSRPSLEKVIKRFDTWARSCSDRILAGENFASFDLQFYEANMRRLRLLYTFKHRGVDLHSACIIHMLNRDVDPPLDKEGNSTLNSDAIFAYVGLPSEPKPHHALTGAKMEAEAFSRLIYGKGLLPEYESVDLNEFLSEKE